MKLHILTKDGKISPKQMLADAMQSDDIASAVLVVVRNNGKIALGYSQVNSLQTVGVLRLTERLFLDDMMDEHG